MKNVAQCCRTKLCRGCMDRKSIKQFWVDRCRPGGRESHCKECRSKRRGTRQCKACLQRVKVGSMIRVPIKRGRAGLLCRTCYDAGVPHPWAQQHTLPKPEPQPISPRRPRTCWGCSQVRKADDFHDGARWCWECTAASEPLDEPPKAAPTVEHEPGSEGWRLMMEDREAKREDAFDRLAANTREALGRG